MTFDQDKEIQEWLSALKPRVPREGEFREEHIFDITKENFTIVFNCERDLKGRYDCSTLRIEEKPVKKISN